jgi:hypothetical protein
MKRLIPPVIFAIALCLSAGLCRAGAPAGDIIFTEDFEQFDPRRWDTITSKTIEIVDGGRSGKCVQITSTLGQDTGGHLYKMLSPGLDTCYLRFYVKFEKEHAYIHHFVHLTGYNPPTRWPQGGAGERPPGDRRFSTGIEPWGFFGKYPAPGAWQFYSYWCEMKAARDGRFWGNSFAPEQPALVERDRWTCMEIMLKCNTVGEADGEQAFWIDGREIGRWGGIRWRTDEKLNVNGLWMLNYITENAVNQNRSRITEPRKVNRVWFDDIVVSRSYIGPAQ